MRILIHDFAGHPFQIQLSRELAARGHSVTHVYPIGLNGPSGRLARSLDDSSRLTIVGVPLSRTFRKYSAWRRLIAQRRYARDLKSLAVGGKFDVVLSGNTPIDVQAQLLWACHREGIAFIHWVQDVYCRAIEFVLRRRLGPLAPALAFPFGKLERHVAARSNASIVISPAFRDMLLSWGLAAERISLLENWAPLDEIDPLPRDNAWAREHGLTEKTVFLYSGTLGLKHRPDLLYRLAEELDDSCRVVVVSQGVGREYLEKQLPNPKLVLLDFQPYERLPEVLASADVLLATLEADAGEFAVPSKILSYLCAGRPLLMAAPANNHAVQVIARADAGLVVQADSGESWISAARRFAAEPSFRVRLGQNGRQYAERTFHISSIASAFESVFLQASTRAVAVNSKFAVQTDI